MKAWKLAVTLSSIMFAGQAMAVTISGNSLQNTLDAITLGPVPGDSSTNVDTDQIAYDETWAVSATGGSVSTMIIELAAFDDVNAFGVYDVTDASNQVTLFDGPDAAGSQIAFGIAADGSILINFAPSAYSFAGNNFGYFLKNQQGTFYSQTGLNGDGVDHMVAFAGNGDEVQLPGLQPGIFGAGEYILAFEDVYGGGDSDYEDMVVMVESVNPTPVGVPEPATLALLGLGLAAFGARRKAHL